MYVLDEIKIITGGFYEGHLMHKDVNLSSVIIYNGPKMTGRQITNFAIKRDGEFAKIQISGIDEVVYITYETSSEDVYAPQAEDGTTGFDEWSYFRSSLDTKADKNRTYTKAQVDERFSHVRGPKGDQGEKGDKGDKGDKGERGETGPQGLTGKTGPKGETGLQGLKGDKGDIGPRGEVGPTGPKGDKGDIGPQGPIGPVGPQGPKGDKGDTGAKGATGATGPQGDKGDKGEPGSLSGPITWGQLGGR